MGCTSDYDIHDYCIMMEQLAFPSYRKQFEKLPFYYAINDPLKMAASHHKWGHPAPTNVLQTCEYTL